MLRTIAVLFIAVATNGFLFAQTAHASGVGSERIHERIEQLTRSFPGKIGVFARNVETGEEIGYNGDELFPMASTYKVPIMITVFRESEADRLSLEERVQTTEADRRLGSGLLTHLKPALNPTLYDVVVMMMSTSDNEATDMLLARIGVPRVNAVLRDLAIRNMRVDRTTQQILGDWIHYVDPSAKADFSEQTAVAVIRGASRDRIETADRAFTDDPRDHASPRAMTDLLTKLVLNEAATAKSCGEMLGIMRLQEFTDRIPRYLEGVPVAAKNGTIQYTTNDVGVIFAGKHHIALTIYTLKQNLSVTTDEAQDRIGRIARVIYDYFQVTDFGQ
jgi:beta-lactamase class A